MQKVLFIGKVWPEPKSSAAGTRILQLVDLFLDHEYQIVFASTASKSAYSHPFNNSNIIEKTIRLNDVSFNNFIIDLQPDIVVFDRFMTEEQFGWRVRKYCPSAMTILDTEDLHFLRQAREVSYKNNEPINLFTPLAQREIASILKCDLSLIISKKEIEILTESFKVNPNILYYLPFLEDISFASSLPTFEDRSNFIFIGNYLHQPNYQTVLELKKNIWPLIRKKLPRASMHIYGAYASNKVTQLHNPQERFIVKGRAENARETLAQYKVLLAPIPFGAGTKGKFIDAMHSGTPSVTTAVGAESMQWDQLWNGYISKINTNFAERAVSLYLDKNLWTTAQNNGYKILSACFDKTVHIQEFWDKLNGIKVNLSQHRQHNFIGEILKSNQMNANKYMSLWIEAKNKP